MINTPKCNRVHISFFGRTNVGKSSLINAITNQQVSLVSNTAGTTTDPVYKSMELLPLGPVTFIDTAGFDDKSSLGNLRINKTKSLLSKTDLAIIVFSNNSKDFTTELDWYTLLSNANIPTIGIINKKDLKSNILNDVRTLFNIPIIQVSSHDLFDIENLKNFIVTNCPSNYESKSIVSDLLPSNALVILVMPQDSSAPKGRLILPQVQVIRELLDNNSMALTVKETELKTLLNSLNRKPDLVITDSQVFKYVNETLNKDIPLTSFSILMARYKGDLKTFIEGANALDSLKSGDKILICEACTHHSQKGDIAREKLPQWILDKYPNVNIDNCQGEDFPTELSQYKLVIHCGGCMFNKKQLISRILYCKSLNIPITNFGIVIAKLNDILDKSVSAFTKFV